MSRVTAPLAMFAKPTGRITARRKHVIAALSVRQHEVCDVGGRNAAGRIAGEENAIEPSASLIEPQAAFFGRFTNT